MLLLIGIVLSLVCLSMLTVRMYHHVHRTGMPEYVSVGHVRQHGRSIRARKRRHRHHNQDW